MKLLLNGLLAVTCVLQAKPAAPGVGDQKQPLEIALSFRGAVLIRHPLVQKEVDVRPGQLKRLQPHIDRCLKELEAEPPAESQYARAYEEGYLEPHKEGGYVFEAKERLQKQIRRVLTRPQAKRFEQLVVQAEGVHAFWDPAVQKALGLTTEQRKTFHELMGAMLLNRGKKPPAGRGHAAVSRFAVENEEETYDRVVAVLSDDQKKAWAEMVGTTYTPLFGKASVLTLERLRIAERLDERD